MVGATAVNNRSREKFVHWVENKKMEEQNLLWDVVEESRGAVFGTDAACQWFGSAGDYAGVFTEDLLLFETSTSTGTADVDGWVERSLDYLWFSHNGKRFRALSFCLSVNEHMILWIYTLEIFLY